MFGAGQKLCYGTSATLRTPFFTNALSPSTDAQEMLVNHSRSIGQPISIMIGLVIVSYEIHVLVRINTFTPFEAGTEPLEEPLQIYFYNPRRFSNILSLVNKGDHI